MEHKVHYSKPDRTSNEANKFIKFKNHQNQLRQLLIIDSEVERFHPKPLQKQHDFTKTQRI